MLYGQGAIATTFHLHTIHPTTNQTPTSYDLIQTIWMWTPGPDFGTPDPRSDPRGSQIWDPGTLGLGSRRARESQDWNVAVARRRSKLRLTYRSKEILAPCASPIPVIARNGSHLIKMCPAGVHFGTPNRDTPGV